ncbi:hypothetical protein HanXRQr2_Chr06g0257361 [Helianthus annuus]|uniref:Uncharacterized protein n=1 Tax=Helianthus annuus TaxID=4232 RepID=A0A9K3ISZ4_HELAN|nr:hypothetical protein HanXRQr2_Chr06g0257361 [Helianthus annuus]KAJ0915303.1 hypothetical protein HanPSC8_Chr06g0248351 [Helianthus annuus]
MYSNMKKGYITKELILLFIINETSTCVKFSPHLPKICNKLATFTFQTCFTNSMFSSYFPGQPRPSHFINR